MNDFLNSALKAFSRISQNRWQTFLKPKDCKSLVLLSKSSLENVYIQEPILPNICLLVNANLSVFHSYAWLFAWFAHFYPCVTNSNAYTTIISYAWIKPLNSTMHCSYNVAVKKISPIMWACKLRTFKLMGWDGFHSLDRIKGAGEQPLLFSGMGVKVSLNIP